MLVDITMDRMGNMYLSPVSQKVQAQMRRHFQEMVGHPNDSVFLQDGQPVAEFLEHGEPRLSRSEVSEIERGWKVTKRMDPWVFGHYAGYDFHEVVQP